LKYNVSLLSKVLFSAAIITLIFNAYFVSIDHQDVWVLQGLEASFIFFVVVFAFSFFTEKRLTFCLAFAIIARTVLIALPSIKYVWFQGFYLDQNVQYYLTSYLNFSGHIAPTSIISVVYKTTPLLHLSLSVFSTVSTTSIVFAMKFLPIFWSIIYPFLIYVLIRKINFFINNEFVKYVIFISAFPISLEQYVITGGIFGNLLLFSIITLIVLTYDKKDKFSFFVLLFLVTGLAASHSVSSIILVSSLLVIFLLQKIKPLGITSFISWRKILMIFAVSSSWLVFQASTTLQEIGNIFFDQIPTGTTPVSEYISSTFYERLQINPLAQISSFVVYYGADFFFLALTVVGLIILLFKSGKLNKPSRFILIFGIIILVFLAVGTLAKAGGPRALGAIRLLFPVFAGVVVLKIGRKTRSRSIILALILSLIIILSTIQFYGYQPLIPSANTFFNDVPSSEYLSSTGIVNSIYQRKMIIFAQNYVVGELACVDPTTTQIIGLWNSSSSLSRVANYYPLDNSLPVQKYNYFLVQTPGISGIPGVDPRLRVPEVVGAYISNQTIIYTNGESYIVSSETP
jgi:hypothetical protein